MIIYRGLGIEAALVRTSMEEFLSCPAQWDRRERFLVA